MTYASSTAEPVDRNLSTAFRTEQYSVEGGATAAVIEIDPLADTRWDELVARHPNSSIFHTRPWLEALRRTYGYRPVVYATTRGAQVEEAVVFCRIDSPLTGRRLVSLPFSDHCQPLARGAGLHTILERAREEQRQRGLRYIELRPLACDPHLSEAAFGESERFVFHALDLRPELPALFKGMHATSVRQRINRADREGLTYEVGRSEELLAKFRKLLLLTRRRHKVPPQPAEWFCNIAMLLGDKMRVHLVSKNGEPVASIITLHFGRQITYKYGCSDPRFNNLGGTPVLIWKVIEQAKQEGATLLDLGRSDPSNPGLTSFKARLGAKESGLCYYRALVRAEGTTRSARSRKWAGELVARMPDRLLSTAGKLLYRHLG